MILFMFLLSLALGALWVIAAAVQAAASWYLFSVLAYVVVLLASSAVKLFYRRDFPFGLSILSASLLLVPIWIAAFLMNAAAVWFIWPVFGIGVIALISSLYFVAGDFAAYRERRVVP